MGPAEGTAHRGWRGRGTSACGGTRLPLLPEDAREQVSLSDGQSLGRGPRHRAVGAISLPELRDRQERGLEELLESALPAVLEIGAAMQTAAAWEIEARLIYDEFAWFLYEELWDLSATHRPAMSANERRRRIDEVLDPLLDPSLSDADRASLVADLFMSVLAAHVLPLLGQ